jgi:transposase
MPNPRAVEVVLSGDERVQLEAWARRRKSAQALAQRSRIVLAAADGLKNTEIAERLGIERGMAARWRSRFARDRLDGLVDEPRPGRPRTVSDQEVEEVIVKTLETTPKDATHWSTRSMAAETGLSQSAVSRIWRAFGLAPHRQETWKLSKDPQFVEKVRDVVGLYLDPPERAIVLCVDEESQIQALDRTAPIFPMMPGVPERATHDYRRSGTSSLYAALDIASGKVIGSLHSRHRAIEFKSAGSPNSPTRSSAAAPTAQFANSTPTSATGSTPGTRTPAHSSGPRPPTTSSNQSPATAPELTTHNTRGRRHTSTSSQAGVSCSHMPSMVIAVPSQLLCSRFVQNPVLLWLVPGRASTVTWQLTVKNPPTTTHRLSSSVVGDLIASGQLGAHGVTEAGVQLVKVFWVNAALVPLWVSVSSWLQSIIPRGVPSSMLTPVMWIAHGGEPQGCPLGS